MANQQESGFSGWFVMLALVTSIVASGIAKQHMQSNAATGVGGCSIALIVVAKIRWELKEKWWFWVALLVGAALQVPLILLLPWSDAYLTGIGAMTFVIPGFILAFGCVFLTEKAFTRGTHSLK